MLATLQALLKGTKEKVIKEHVNMTEKDDVVKPQSLPPKLKGPGKFTISCNIGGVNISHALCDMGSSINVIPLKTVKELKVGEITPSNIMLTLVDSFMKHPLGVVQDVLVHVDGLTFPIDVVVIDMKNDSEGSVILRRPFLATGKEKIDMETSELILKFNKENMVFDAYQWTPYVDDIETCYQLKEKGSEVHKRRKKGVFTGVRICKFSTLALNRGSKKKLDHNNNK
ncbi:uncharacterized protein LOC127101804 [Lathyrus oleraceus]|uniref:uncharacterized protein LOC127101804 n=1 Tax=Pisum sativum TaxID=3888 RepID=UPI0021D397CF|nr:uncharacterized protein LOC127101804 [Pisum sativum]